MSAPPWLLRSFAAYFLLNPLGEVIQLLGQRVCLQGPFQLLLVPE